MSSTHRATWSEDELYELRTRMTTVMTNLELARRRLAATDHSEIARLNAEALSEASRLAMLLKRPRAATRPPRARRTMLRLVAFPRRSIPSG